jgi:hypothetical protein
MTSIVESANARFSQAKGKQKKRAKVRSLARRCPTFSHQAAPSSNRRGLSDF